MNDDEFRAALDWHMTYAQCDDGRTPCDPPRPREAGCWWTSIFRGEQWIDFCDPLDSWASVRARALHRGPACTASEAT